MSKYTLSELRELRYQLSDKSYTGITKRTALDLIDQLIEELKSKDEAGTHWKEPDAYLSDCCGEMILAGVVEVGTRIKCKKCGGKCYIFGTGIEQNWYGEDGSSIQYRARAFGRFISKDGSLADSATHYLSFDAALMALYKYYASIGVYYIIEEGWEFVPANMDDGLAVLFPEHKRGFTVLFPERKRR